MGSVIGVPRNWGQSVVLWNLALDERNGPFIGGCDDCRGVVTVNDDGTVTKELEYWALGHASRFVRPGAVRIGSSQPADRDRPGEGLTNVAFANRGRLAGAGRPQRGPASPLTFDVQVGDRHFTATLAAGSGGDVPLVGTGPACAGDRPRLGRSGLRPRPGRHARRSAVGQRQSRGGRRASRQVKLGEQWLSYSLPYGARAGRPGPATVLPRTGWKLSAGRRHAGGDRGDPLEHARRRTGRPGGAPVRARASEHEPDVDLGRHADVHRDRRSTSEFSIGDYLRSYAVQISDDGATLDRRRRGPGTDRRDDHRAARDHDAVPPDLSAAASSGSWWSISRAEPPERRPGAAPAAPGRPG